MTESARKHARYERDLDFVQCLVEDVEKGIGDVHPILNIYAIAGFGKSTFLGKVEEKFRRKQPTTLVHVADFKGEHEGGYELDSMLRRMVADLQNGLPRWAQLDLEATELTGLVDQLKTMTRYAVENGKTALVLVDDYDQLPPGTRVLFDEAVLSRLVKKSERAVVILTSEQELPFTDRLDLKVHLKTRPLSKFTEDDIKITTPQYTDLAEEILKWTGGVSELVKFLIRELGRHSIGTLEDYYAHKKELLKGAYREHVDAVVFNGLPEPARQAMPILSLLRRFDVSTLRSILPQIIPDFESYTTRQYLELIDQLGSRVQWRDEGGYALDDALRTILSNYIQAYDQPTYRKVHRVAERVYKGWLQGRYRNYYLREMLYHKVAQETLSPEIDFPSIVQLVSVVLLEYIRGECKPGPCDNGDIDELRTFKESLEQDKDLNKFISSEVWEAIRAKETSVACGG